MERQEGSAQSHEDGAAVTDTICVHCRKRIVPAKYAAHVRDTGDVEVAPEGACLELFWKRNRLRLAGLLNPEIAL